MITQVTALISAFIGLMFLTGKGCILGLEGSEPGTLSVPQNTIVGWAFIALGMLLLLPPWLVARVSRAIKRLIKRHELDKKLLLRRIKDSEKE
jgi:hypothetical protein